MPTVQLTDELARLGVASLSDIPTTPAEVGAATSAQGTLASTAVQPATLTSALAGKVNVDGAKVLSDENYSTAEKDKLVGVATNANAYAHPNHTGDVISTGDGATVIANDVVTNAKLANMPTARIKGRVTAATGDTEDLTAAQVRTMINVADGATANSPNATLLARTNHTGTQPASTISDLSTTIDAKITASTRTDTATSGTGSTSALNVTVAPTANSTRVTLGKKVEISYSSSFNITTGGYLVAGQDVLNTSGTGTIDKLVGRMVQLNLTGGNIAAAVGVEAVLSTIAVGTTVSGLAFYYVPSMAGVPNIANVLQMAAFQNDDPRAYILNRGKLLDGDLIEFAPPYHIGLLAGRYYSAPAKSMASPTPVAANTIYVTFVNIPSRATITKLGFNVTAGSAGNAIIGLYKVKASTLTTIVAQTSSISTATTGAKEGTISAEVNAGTYALVGIFSGTPTINWHEVGSHSVIGSLSPTGYSEVAYISSAFGALPATANIVPTFAANTIEPHFTFRL